MRRLTLTTPHMKNEDVRAAQTQLKKREWLQGAVDGEFGPDSFRATKRAQYYMGFKELNGVYTIALHKLLTGAAKLSKQQVARRKKRLHKPEQPKRLVLLKEMRERVGKLVEDPPGSNKVPGVTDWYGISGPWCAMVVTRCGVLAKLRAFTRGSRYAYVPYIVADARAGKNGLAITYKPLPGNLVCYDWNDDGVADHVGVFEKWADEAHTQFWTYEGNTSKTNLSNGGNQEHNIRNKSDVQAFVHCHESEVEK